MQKKPPSVGLNKVNSYNVDASSLVSGAGTMDGNNKAASQVTKAYDPSKMGPEDQTIICCKNFTLKQLMHFVNVYVYGFTLFGFLNFAIDVRRTG